MFFTLFQQKSNHFVTLQVNQTHLWVFPLTNQTHFVNPNPIVRLWHYGLTFPKKKLNHCFDFAQFSAKCQNHFVEFSSILRFKKHLEVSTGHPRSLQIGREGLLEISTWHPWAYQVTTFFCACVALHYGCTRLDPLQNSQKKSMPTSFW